MCIFFDKLHHLFVSWDLFLAVNFCQLFLLIKKSYAKLSHVLFLLSYVSAMVPVKSVKEYETIQEITVLFSETTIR